MIRISPTCMHGCSPLVRVNSSVVSVTETKTNTEIIAFSKTVAITATINMLNTTTI